MQYLVKQHKIVENKEIYDLLLVKEQERDSLFQ